MAEGKTTNEGFKYDAFISYSHQADSDLAPQMRAVLQRIAKPWNRRRSLNIFLDKAVLTGTSELGESLNERIADTKYLVLLLSESTEGVKGSAQSEWVGGEIQEWVRAKSKDRIALVCTSGTFMWDREAQEFDFENSTALNPGLRGVYAGQDTEPYILDLRWTRDPERVPGGPKSLDYNHQEFKDYIATLSATIQGKTKDEVFGADRDAFRLARRLKRLAITGLAVLFVASVIAAVVAGFNYLQSEKRERQARSGARAADARNNVVKETDLAALLALEGVRVSDTADARGSLAELLATPTRFIERTDEHEAAVRSIAFSEDGRLAASGDDVGVITVWDVAESSLSYDQAAPRPEKIQLGRPLVDVFVFVDEGTEFVVAFDDSGTLSFVDVAAVDSAFVLEPPADFQGSTTFNPATGDVAGLTEDGVLRVYRLNDDLSGYQEVNSIDLEDLAGAVEVMRFSPDGQALAVAIGNVFFVWDIGTNDVRVGGEEGELVSGVISLAFGPDDDLANAVLAVGEVDGGIWLYDRNDLTLREQVDPRQTNPPIDIAFKPVADESGEFSLASIHSDGEVILWSVLPGGGESTPFGFQLDSLLGHKELGRTVAFQGDGRIASGSFDGQVIWWSDFPFSSLGIAMGHQDVDNDMVDAAFVTPGRVVSLEEDGDAWLWDLDAFAGARIDAGAAVRSIDGAAGTIALGLEDGSALILDANGAEIDRLGPAHEAPIGDVALSSDAAGLVTVSAQEGAVRAVIWDVASREQTEVDLPDGFEPESVLHAGAVWIGGDVDGESIALESDPGTGAEVGRLVHDQVPGNSVSALAISEDGATLATGGEDRKILLWDTATGERKSGEFAGHRDIVWGVVFVDGGNTLISADEAGTVIMWDVEKRRQFGVLGGPTDTVESLEVEGDMLLAASEDDRVWTWNLDEATWRARACDLAGRNMTETEWELYGSGGSIVRHCPFEEPAGARPAEYGATGPIPAADLASLVAPAIPAPAEAAAAPTTEEAPVTEEPSVTSTTLAPTTTEPTATTATQAPTTTTPLPESVSGEETLNLSQGERDGFGLEVPAGATLAVAIERASALDVDLYVLAPGDADDDPTCASEEDGNDESCGGVADEAGEWRVLVVNFVASDAPPDEIVVTWQITQG